MLELNLCSFWVKEICINHCNTNPETINQTHNQSTNWKQRNTSRARFSSRLYHRISINDPKFLDCDKGFFHNSTSNTCSECPIGTFKERRGHMRCYDCDFGHTTLTTGSVNHTQCILGNSITFYVLHIALKHCSWIDAIDIMCILFSVWLN